MERDVILFCSNGGLICDVWASDILMMPETAVSQ
jgi:hypothetical protein